MKTSALIVAAAAAVVSANNPGNVPYSCAKPNAAYCLGGDIILRCDENAIGTPGKCGANLSGYPPAGGVATCWESSKEAGDAACAKNCIVHAEPAFTLPESECTPAWTNSTTTTTTVITSTLTQPSGTWFPNTTYTHPPQPTDECPDGPTTWPTLTTTYTIPPPPPGTGVPPPPGTGIPPPPGNGTGNGTTTWSNGPGGPGGAPTNVPVGPTTTSPGGTVPTGAAVANHAGTFLAAAGLVAAYLI